MIEGTRAETKELSIKGWLVLHDTSWRGNISILVRVAKRDYTILQVPELFSLVPYIDQIKKTFVFHFTCRQVQTYL